MSHNDNFISLINSTFRDKKRSIQDLTQGATYEDIFNSDFNSYFLGNLLKKADGLDLGVDPDRVALDDFNLFLKEQDEKVVKVATILENLDNIPVLNRILCHVKRLMAKFFADWSVVSLNPRFTSGATLSLQKGSSIFARVKASEGHKVLKDNFSRLYDTSDCSAYSESLLWKLPHTEGTSDWFVRIETVAKTAFESRIIGLGPSAALAHQCGFADWLVDRLKSFCDIDMSTAPDLHKELAKVNSLDGPLSTQDQKKASDNILRILAEFLLPTDVYDYMDAITPSTIEVEGTMRHTHMLCPAGNGFNSPFQTLLFWALIKGIQMEINVKHPVYVYGDDVIVHNSVYNGVINTFPLLGLEINPSKSFKNGPFRESCGGDYLYGVNIRSFYAKSIPKSTIDWIKFANGVRRVGYYNNASTWRSSELNRLWFRSILHIPKSERKFCPRHYGDAGINSESVSLYDIEPALKFWVGENGRRARYPNNGFDANGNPYAAERINIYVACLGGDRTSFGDESQGLSNVLVLRTLASPYLVGAGSKVLRKPSFYGKTSFYPAVFGGKFEKHVIQSVPYTLFGAAPEDIDELFAFLKENGKASHITDKDQATKRLHVNSLISLLRMRESELQRLERGQALQKEALEQAALFTSASLLL